ncbi:hypothetical protein BD626DRAFT_566549 [Schizophyllum amplum]|uniref:VHS domain-containing protein n=1 Tax=Schizophyllum amplum TaxID=97359 RepID=A0A550CM81_9AGAR|nr:hypothetical protein BD626DRAFT_566549 [Auriculariopsis ampla]
MSFAKAFSRDKPHSSITDWVDILTANTIDDEAYDGIPELVDSINLQASGPTEASRALRKKIKHGGPHQQYRALVLLKALVENCGQKFQRTFADGQLTDALRHLASDSATDKKVKRKLLLVLGSWHEQFKGDPSMSMVSGLYKQYRPVERRPIEEDPKGEGGGKGEEEKEEEEARVRARNKNRPRRAPFNFEQEKPKVLGSIVEASQASSNLVNAITLVNPEKESLKENTRVQECLEKAKTIRKQIVRYIQLVENEEIIGVLIETNDRIIGALEMYDKLSTPDTQTTESAADAITAGLARTKISMPESEVARLQERQRVAVERSKRQGKEPHDISHLHPDLEDLTFGGLGETSGNLPAPMRPTSATEQDIRAYDRGSLSDFSDYESSDEETHKRNASTSRREYLSGSDDDEDTAVGFRGANDKGGLIDTGSEEDDPFADPFADATAVGSSKKF